LVREDEDRFANATLLADEVILESNDETFQPLVSPDGKKIAYLRNRIELMVLDLETKQSSLLVPGRQNFSYTDGDITYAWSPDSRWLTVTYHAHKSWTPEVGVVELATGKIVNISESGYDEGSPKFAAGGKALLYTSDRFGERSHGSWGGERDVLAFYLTQDSYDEAVKIDRNCKKAWYNRSNVLLHLNRHLEALKSYEHMLTLDPEDYRALNGKGSTLAKLVRYPEAIEAYQESIYYSKKQYWRAWNNLGWAFINSVKSYKQALKKWTDGLNALKPETTDRYQEGCGVLHHSIGKVYYREGRKQGKREYWHKAKKNYEEALKFLENNSMLVEKYLLVLQDLYGIYLGLAE
jgi:tetratricopeptide (TPR) repeat protein